MSGHSEECSLADPSHYFDALSFAGWDLFRSVQPAQKLNSSSHNSIPPTLCKHQQPSNQKTMLFIKTLAVLAVAATPAFAQTGLRVVSIVDSFFVFGRQS